MSIGLFGGTFDPIHNGHLRMALALRDELQLDEVRLIPAGVPYHRSHVPDASAAQRLAMAQLAIAGQPGLQIDTREIHRPRAAYTVETLREIRTETGPDTPLWWLLGADSYAQLESWWHWQELLELSNLAVAARPGFDPAQLTPPLSALWQERQTGQMDQPSGIIRCLALPPVDISASALRKQLLTGDVPAIMIPSAVLDYISHHHLYGYN